MSNCYFWINTSDRKKLVKDINTSEPLIAIPATAFRYKEPMNVLRPSFTLHSGQFGSIDWAQINYCHLPKLGRYYFCKITTENDGILRFECEVDPLMSYASALLSTQFEIARATNLNSPWYIDSERPVQADHYLNQKIIADFPESTGNNYIMTVAGGSAT